MAIASLSTSALPRPATNRVFCLDTLRIVLTILVIARYVGQAYGPTHPAPGALDFAVGLPVGSP